MASFPEFLRFRAGLFSDVPKMPGLLDMPPQGPPQPQGRPGGFGRALGTIFGGQDDPRLSPEENERARKAAMIQSGLGILASPDSGLRAIAQGGLYGQQAGAEERKAIYGRTQEDRITNALNDPALMAKIPPELRAVLPYLPPDAALKIITESFKTGEPKVVGDALVGPDGKVIYSGPGISDDAMLALRSLGVDPAKATQAQWEQARKLVIEAKRAGATTIDMSGGIGKLPVTAQSAIVAVQGVRDALSEFEQYSKEYMALPATERGASQLGIPGEKTDELLGNLESTRQSLVLTVKNLAELGVLSGPDVGIIDKMIGDPTSWNAVVRDPNYILTRSARVREYIDSKVNAYEQTYGVKVPTGQTPAPAAGGGGTNRFQNLVPGGG